MKEEDEKKRLKTQRRDMILIFKFYTFKIVPITMISYGFSAVFFSFKFDIEWIIFVYLIAPLSYALMVLVSHTIYTIECFFLLKVMSVH